MVLLQHSRTSGTSHQRSSRRHRVGLKTPKSSTVWEENRQHILRAIRPKSQYSVPGPSISELTYLEIKSPFCPPLVVHAGAAFFLMVSMSWR